MQTKLSQILSSLESGGRPKGGASLDNNGIPSLGAEHLDSNGGFNFKSVKYIPEDYFKKLKSGIIEKGNILIVKDGATTGKVSFVNEEFPFDKAAVNEHVFLLKIDNSKADPRFAFHYLKCPQGQSEIMRDFRGATVGGISRGFVEFVKFELPSLPDQLHIAKILSKAENLITQRKESIRLLDDFLKSTFLEMFGDPVRNEKGWDKVKIKDSGNVVTGTTPPSSKEGMFGGEIPFITPSDLESDEPNKRFVTKIGAEYSRTVRQGATFICCIGATIGKVQRAKSFSAFNQQLNAIEWNSSFNDLFGERLMKFMKPRIVAKGGGSTTLPILNKGDFEKIVIIRPSIKLQTQFAQIVEKTEALKSQYKQSLQELENLYGSLSQRAFKGELISRTEILNKP